MSPDDIEEKYVSIDIEERPLLTEEFLRVDGELQKKNSILLDDQTLSILENFEDREGWSQAKAIRVSVKIFDKLCDMDASLAHEIYNEIGSEGNESNI